MSNFAARLDELMEKATGGPWLVSHDGDYSLLYVNYPAHGIKVPLAEVYSNMQETDANFIAYLVNHAPAIRDLVRAAENYRDDENYVTRHAMIEALAKLEEACALKQD